MQAHKHLGGQGVHKGGVAEDEARTRLMMAEVPPAVVASPPHGSSGLQAPRRSIQVPTNHHGITLCTILKNLGG